MRILFSDVRCQRRRVVIRPAWIRFSVGKAVQTFDKIVHRSFYSRQLCGCYHAAQHVAGRKLQSLDGDLIVIRGE